MEKVNIKEKFKLFDAHWQPKIAGELNDQLVKLAKLKGEFVWHRHENEDEFFLVIEGHLTIKLPDRDIELEAGEFFIVPRGTEHMPVADEEAHVLLFEPRSTLNTGDAETDRTVFDPEEI